MPKHSSLAWVKNVHNLRIDQWIHRVRFSPILNKQLRSEHNSTDNSPLFPSFIPAGSPQLSTNIIRQFNLLYSRLYTQSTVPTITTKKKI